MSVRLDKWLWAARFFKTRALARAAVQGGKVHLNGARVKPARTLSVGDELRVQRGDEALTIHVVELSDRRGPASVAQTLFEETGASRERREAVAAERKLQREARAGRERRPDKRQRRKIIRFRKGQD